jgi:hypothetical protein
VPEYKKSTKIRVLKGLPYGADFVHHDLVMVHGQIVCKVSSQLFGIFNVGFSFWPPSKDGMIDNNTC